MPIRFHFCISQNGHVRAVCIKLACNFEKCHRNHKYQYPELRATVNSPRKCSSDNSDLDSFLPLFTFHDLYSIGTTVRFFVSVYISHLQKGKIFDFPAFVD